MKVKKYDSGLTVIIEENNALRSVTAGIMVGTGSAYETPENSGISHFIEHMHFKGTAKRKAQDIVNDFDAAGAVYNAYTGKEYTCYYFKSIDEKTDYCFEILSDLFLHSSFTQAELDRERKVILEEINMSFDEPDGMCYDALYGTAFAGDSLGMEILGTKDNVSRFGKADILDYKSKRYLPADTVVAFVGNITERDALGIVEKYMREFIDVPARDVPRLEHQSVKSGYGEFIRDYEQSELSIAYPCMSVGDERAPVLSALDCILGSGMSSRLFQRLREEMGVVYSVYTSPWLGSANGLFGVCANVNVQNLEKSVRAIRGEIDKIVEFGVTEEETQKAKTQLKVNVVFAKENPMSYMQALMRRRVLLGEDYDIDKLLVRIDKITREDINALARVIFSGEPTIAYAGKKPPCDIARVYNESKK